MKSTTRSYGDLDVVVRNNSLLTFHECTTLARAVHGKDFSGNVTADISSQVLCNHGMGQYTPTPLPKCEWVPGLGFTVQLEAKTYFQNESFASFPDCHFIGKPGTTIVNGLNGLESANFIGPINFEGGTFSAWNWVTFSGANITFTNCSTTLHVGATISNASLLYNNSTVMFGDTHTFEVVSSVVTFVRSNLADLDEGVEASFTSSKVRFIHSSIEAVRETTIMKSTTRSYGDLDVVVRNNSLLTFHECTTLARAVHGKDFSGNVTADISSQVLCNH